MKKMTTPSLEKILKAKKAEERAIENAEMKMLYSAYVESGLGIEEAIQLLKDHTTKVHQDCCENQDDCGKSDNKPVPILRFFILRIDYPTLLVAFGLRPRFFGLYFLLHCSFAVLVIHSVGVVIPKASQIFICSELNVVI